MLHLKTINSFFFFNKRSTFAVGWVGGRPSSAGVLCEVGGKVLVISICGGVDRTESGVSGVGGE